MASTIQHHDPSQELIFSFFVLCERQIIMYFCIVDIVVVYVRSICRIECHKMVKTYHSCLHSAFGWQRYQLTTLMVQDNKMYVLFRYRGIFTEQMPWILNGEEGLFRCEMLIEFRINRKWRNYIVDDDFHLYLLINCKVLENVWLFSFNCPC